MRSRKRCETAEYLILLCYYENYKIENDLMLGFAGAGKDGRLLNILLYFLL